MTKSFIGLTLGKRYKINKQLGEGGMGIVLEAYDLILDRPVAVKIIQPDDAWSEKAIEAFILEARVIAKLEHPHILSVYDLGLEDVDGQELVYFVMRLAQAGTLAERLDNYSLYVGEIERIMVAVCKAIAYAHRQGVVHLDLKPLNILFDNHDNPLVADFGLSKMLQKASQVQADAEAGTSDYMPLEQALGEQAGPYSDVYALGITLYEMLMGELPLRKWNGEIHFDNTLPAAIVQVIKQATEPQSQRRIATVHEFMQSMVNAFKVAFKGQKNKALVQINATLPVRPSQRRQFPTFIEMHQKIESHQHALASDLLTIHEFNDQFHEIFIQDSTGNSWYFDETGQWYRQDEHNWIAASFMEHPQKKHRWEGYVLQGSGEKDASSTHFLTMLPAAIYGEQQLKLVLHYLLGEPFYHDMQDSQVGMVTDWEWLMDVSHPTSGLAQLSLYQHGGQSGIAGGHDAVAIQAAEICLSFILQHLFSPQAPDAYLKRGQAWLHCGIGSDAYLKAVADFTHAIYQNPTNAMAFAYRAEAYRHTQQWQAAVFDYTMAIQLAPSTWLYLDRAKARQQQGDIHGALEDCIEVARIKPDAHFALAYALIGDLYYNLAQYKDALVAYQKYTTHIPDPANTEVLERIRRLEIID